MNKIGIITLNGNNNYGNKLQHYALQTKVEYFNFKVETIRFGNYKNSLLKWFKHLIKIIIRKRYRFFSKFDKIIKYYKKDIINSKFLISNINNNFNYFIVGSDQVWNPNFACKGYHLLAFTKGNKKVSYAASIGLNNVDDEIANKFKKYLTNYKAISVREDSAKKIIEDITGRKDVEVLLDPTMLLSSDEWDKVSKRPKQLNKIGNKKYILNYFLGNLSEKRRKEIDRIAKENDCYVINILDKNDPFYVCGPSEFLYLEKHAFLICTDSFHSSVFAILYNRPFVVFDREQKGMDNMGSRIDTLLSKFKLEDRRYNGKITDKLLKCDYKDAYKILEVERKKSDNFLRRALDIKD